MVKVRLTSVSVPELLVPVRVKVYVPCGSWLMVSFASSSHRSNHLALMPLRELCVATAPVLLLVTTALTVSMFCVQVTIPRMGKEEFPCVRLWTILLP